MKKRAPGRESEASAAAEIGHRDIAAVVAHELRVPLSAVMGGMAALETLDGLPAAALPWCALIKRNVAIVQRLVEDLLTSARSGRAHLQVESVVLDLHPLLRDVITMFAEPIRRDRVQMQLVLEAERTHVRGDPTRLAQVFWNLLQNAFKFTPAGGRVELRTWNEGRTLMVSVQDSGAGIRPSELPRLFRPFTQGAAEVSRARGLGLGLYLCRTLIQKHGGRIRATSAGEGQGSRFTVQLPLTGQPRRAATPRALSTTPAAGANRPKARVLLVDDHADTLEALSILLRQHGYDVRIATRAEETLAVARQGFPFDVVVSDVALPDGNGLDLCKQLLRARRGARAISTSGFGAREDIAASRSAGCSEHFTKPIAPAALMAAIDRLVAARTTKSDRTPHRQMPRASGRGRARTFLT